MLGILNTSNMTRKCALCKATNYKRKYSFFSAPKDPEIRKKWQAAIPIANYTVTDDTYVCSKHFRSCDIITHWISGVPPYVITIKYKKFRLKAGAVPCLNFENNDDAPEIVMTDQLNRCDELLDNKMDFLIPREKTIKSIAVSCRVTESNFHDSNEGIEPPAKFGKYETVIDQNNGHFNRTEYIDDNGSYATYTLNNDRMQDSIISIEDTGFHESRNHSNYKNPQIQNAEKHMSVINEALKQNTTNKQDEELQDDRIHCDVYLKETLLSHNLKLEENAQVFSEELIIQDDGPGTLYTEHLTDNAEENHDNASENQDETTKKQELGNNLLEALQYKFENTSGQENLDSGLCETMLFEDLLEIYTEVTLPRGWAFLVTSKGHTTTVVYLYMNMSQNHIPVVEKEVYIKSDMVMHCAVGSREINPLLHNLIKNGRKNKVHALSDIEELIDELNQRYICEGGPNIHNFTDIEAQLAYIDGTKWRHVGCPIIVNNGSSKCSKCVSLNGVIDRRKNKNTGLSVNILGEKQKTIESLRRSLRKMTRRIRRLEGIRLRFKHRLRLLLANSEKTIEHRTNSSDMPEIQKLMINECLKASTFKNRNNVRYSETWIFLCLLLYVESPRIYKYMFVNNYMALPSMGTIKKYFNQIKTDPQFYNLFQRSVEPYQPVNDQDEEKTP